MKEYFGVTLQMKTSAPSVIMSVAMSAGIQRGAMNANVHQAISSHKIRKHVMVRLGVLQNLGETYQFLMALHVTLQDLSEA